MMAMVSGLASARDQFMSELAATLLARRPAARPLCVGVDGMSCAGKSRFADELGAAMHAQGVAEILRASIDGFHAPAERRYRAGRDSPEGYYRDCFDYDQLAARLLRPLATGPYPVSVATAVFDYRADRAAVRTTMAAAPAILLFDGLFLLRPELARAWDVLVLLDIDETDALDRAHERDAAFFGGIDEVDRRYRQRYNPGWRLYCAEARPLDRADAVIDHRDPANPRFLRRAWQARPEAGPSH